MPDLILSSCGSKPLAGYLKAAGILRLVSEQEDPSAKGWWNGECFSLRSKLGKDDLAAFFCERYIPSPIISPWNGGSGFYLGDAKDGMEAIEKSSHPKFRIYRDVITQIKSWPDMPTYRTIGDIVRTLHAAAESDSSPKSKNELERLVKDIKRTAPSSRSADWQNLVLDDVQAIAKDRSNPEKEKFKTWWDVVRKARTKCNSLVRSDGKESLLPKCRALLPDITLLWLDAVCAVQPDGRVSYNPVLGTGGNEGRLELSNNFMQRVAELFIHGDAHKTTELFRSAVFSESIRGLSQAKIGLYDPGRAGGYNQGMGIEAKDFKINPWDFIIALEGSLVLAGALSRRSPTEDRSQFTAPFTVQFSPVGFASSAYTESGRKETWLPLWNSPASLQEVRYLFSEGRASVGRRIARTGIDFSRAVSTLGVDRGIAAFERYAFLERRGKSYVALPAGRFTVSYKPDLELLNELDRVNMHISRFLRGFKNIPAGFQSARQRIDEALFACSKVPDAYTFTNLVRALGTLEYLLALRDKTKEPVLERPLSNLSPRWIMSCDDGSCELRIAAAISSIRAAGSVGPIRSQLSGVDAAKPWNWGTQGDRYWFGGSLAERLSGVLDRRLLEAEKGSTSAIPLEGLLPLCPEDVMPFLWNECDDAKIEELLWGFMLIDWRMEGLPALIQSWAKPLTGHPLSRTWCLLKLLHVPRKIRTVAVRREQRIVHLVHAGRMGDACEVALHRLRVSGLKPYSADFCEEMEPSRLLSSLLVPIRDQWKLESLILGG